jgi:hypothetical protein
MLLCFALLFNTSESGAGVWNYRHGSNSVMRALAIVNGCVGVL